MVPSGRTWQWRTGGGGGPLATQVEADDAEARPEVQLHARAHRRSRRAAGDGRSSRRDRCGDLCRRALRNALEKLAAAVLGRVRRLRDDPGHGRPAVAVRRGEGASPCSDGLPPALLTRQQLRHVRQLHRARLLQALPQCNVHAQNGR